MNQKAVADALRTVLDPELAADIVSLGLVYSIDVEPDRIVVSMTTTTDSCPVGATLIEDAARVLELAFPSATVEVRLLQVPGWEVGMLDEQSRRALGIER